MISIRRSPTSHPAEKQNAKREASALTDNRCFRPRACLKNHFRNLRAPLCGIFYPHSVDVARYAALIRIKSPTNWDSQLTKSLFQTRSKVQNIVSILEWRILWFWRESCPRVCCRGLCRQHRRCWFRYGGPGRRGDRRGWWRWRGHQRC